MDLYYSLMLSFGSYCVGWVGDLEAAALAVVESPLKYHPVCAGTLTLTHYLGRGQRQVGSLTGAVAS